MISNHLSDEQIQEYVLNKENLTDSDVTHIHACEICEYRAKEYRLMFTGIEALPPAAFGFDLSALVIKKLETEALTSQQLHPEQAPLKELSTISSKGISLAMIVTAVLGIISMAGVGWYMQDYFASIVTGISALITYLVTIMILLIIGFLVFDEYRKYNKQINSLDL